VVSSTSTARSQARWPLERRTEISPDILVQYSHKDFLEGRDPVLEAALSYQPEDEKGVDPPEERLAAYTGRYLLGTVHVAAIAQREEALELSISDHVPRSLFRVESALYPITESRFRTDITGVEIQFPVEPGPSAAELILDWMGEKKVLQRAPHDHAHAFELLAAEVERGAEMIRGEKEKYHSSYPNLEAVLNSLGYSHLREDRTQEAIGVFRLNVELFPQSSNAYDSLGEGQLKAGDRDAGLENYRKSLELNPNNANARAVLESIGANE